jgi:hypothetical protein
MAHIDDLPILTAWLRKQSSAGPERVAQFLALCDRQRLEALNEEMRTIARGLRAWVKADDELAVCEWAARVARQLEEVTTDAERAARP